LELYY
jgi:hypothetical protein